MAANLKQPKGSLFDTQTRDPARKIKEAKLVATGLTELLRDALVARGFLGLDEAERVYVLKHLGGKPHIEAAGLSANASKRFLAAMEDMGYAPDNCETLPLM